MIYKIKNVHPGNVYLFFQKDEDWVNKMNKSKMKMFLLNPL